MANEEQTSIENNPMRFLLTWRTMSRHVRMGSPGKIRGLKIWAHEIRADIEEHGYDWTNAAGDELTGGKLTRFLTRMRRAMELNLNRFDEMESQEAFAAVNGQGQHGSPGYIEPMFLKITEVKEIVAEDEWEDFKKEMEI
jgi:hypothetical protein